MAPIIAPDVTEALANWALSPFAGSSPQLTLVFGSRLIDFAANVVGGAATPAARALDGYLLRLPGIVVVPSGTASAEGAAFAYAVAAHALECDDTHQPSSSHPGAVIFPTALALGAETGASLQTVARAVVGGYEVMCRLGEAARPAEQYARGFHPTGTCGAFGAAVTAGILLDLSIREVANALGLAASCSSGSMSFLEGGGWSKLLNAAHAAQSGILAARLAALGYQGPAEAIVGSHGFLAGHSASPVLDPLTRLGEKYELAIVRTSMKAHGCCRYEQGPIDAILALRRAHDFDPVDIESVRIGMLKAGWGIVVEPLAAKRHPASVVESQFSMPFGAALAITRGRAAPQDHVAQNLADPEIARVAALVECYQDDELDAVYPARWPARVEIRLRDGRRLEAHVDHPKGDPENPFGDDELLDKFRSLAPAIEETDLTTLVSLVRERDLTGVPANAVLDALQPMWRSVRARTDRQTEDNA